MYKYKLKNIDCAVCASKIEKALSRLKEVNNVHVNIIDSVLYIDYNNLPKIKSTIKSVEHSAEIEDINREKKAPPEKNKLNELWKIAVVVVLFLTGIIFREELHNSFYSIPEYLVFITAYLISGWSVLAKAFRNILHGRVFDENFLMSIATLGAIAIHELPEAVGVMFFYQVGEYLQNRAVNKSRKSIKALLEIRPDYANLKTAEGIVRKDPDEVEIGEIIIVKAGEKIPLDGEVIEGNSFVNTFALTGEHVPKSIKIGNTVLAGMINNSGLLNIKVTKKFGESSIAKILELVQNAAQKKAKTEKFITRFAQYYTPVVVFIALGIAFIPPVFFNAPLTEWVYRALVILVISCPCALVISIPLGYFGGIGGGSKKGILIKGSNYLDALTELNTVVFDKTGTLTEGVFKVTEIVPKDNRSSEEILLYAAMAESQSNHPIAKSILEAYGKEINPYALKNYNEIPGRGILAEVEDKKILAGNDMMLHDQKIPHEECYSHGTVVHIAIDGNYSGYIKISDVIKEDAFGLVDKLHSLGIKETIMLTGDNETSAKFVAGKLGIKTFYAGLLPENKVNIFEKILEQKNGKGKVAFVGDGINDAPVLARADVGIAMGGAGSDAAVESADIVLMEDKPFKVAESIEIAKDTRKIVWQNIIFAMGVKAFFIALGAFGLASMWEAVFADMGVALLAILNSTRLLK